MQTRIVVATGLLCVTGVIETPGAATLYPIVSSGPDVSAQRPANPEITISNQTTEVSSSSITLKPCAIAPSGAEGSVELRGRTLLLHFHHLNPGRYELRLSRKSNGPLEILGTLVIVDPTLEPDRQATDNKKEASANPESVRLQTDVQINLTSDLRPGDIERIQLAGAGGNAVLVGVFK